MRVLIVDGDAARSEALSRRLRAEGHHVTWRVSTAGLANLVLAEGSNLVLLEADGLPFHALLDLCSMLRLETAPLLLLVGQNLSDVQRAAALEAGADAYLRMPTGGDVLLAQIHALLRRHPLSIYGKGRATAPVSDRWQLDLAAQRLIGRGEETPLTGQEFRLLAYLVRHEGTVVTREALLNAVWGPGYEGSSREVDVYVRYLHQKIEPEPSRPRFLLTVWGRGYRYQGPERGVAR